MIEFRGFGGVSLTDAAGREVRRLLVQPRRLALLSYLAIATPRGFHRRDTLLGLFWPELDQEHARAALRQALHVVRGGVGEATILTRGDEEVGLDWSTIRCDVAEFDAAIERKDLQSALRLYRGRVLEGFIISDAAEFEHWLDAARARYHQTAVQAARRLVEQEEGSGDPAGAVEWARRAVELQPTDEVLAQQLIRVLDRAGDRAGALAAYGELAHRLRETLEIAPSPETQALIGAIREREASAPAASTVAAPSALTQSAITPTPTVTAVGTSGTEGLVQSDHPDSRRGWGAAALAGSVIVAAGLIGTTLLRGRPSVAREPPTRVIVSAFRNLTGERRFNPLGSLAADWIARELDATGLLAAATAGRGALVLGPPSEVPRALTPPDSALIPNTADSSTGRVLLVGGAVYRRGDSLEIHARVTDGRNGTVLRTMPPVTGSIRDPHPPIAAVRERILAYLATTLEPKLSRWANLASQPPSYEAYQAFLEGWRAWHEGLDGPKALPYFHRAATLDSEFTLPAVWAAWIHRALGHCAVTDSIATGLLRRAALPLVDRGVLSVEMAVCRGDLAALYQDSRALAAAVPNSEWLAEQAARNTLSFNRPREALGILTRLHPNRGELQGHTPYYLFLTLAHHMLGEHEAELATARKARQQYPDNLATVRMELLALAALGRSDEIGKQLDGLSRLPPHPMRNPGVAIRETALELRAHGYSQAAEQVLNRAMAWMENQPAGLGTMPTARFELAQTAFAAGQLAIAWRIADSLASEYPDSTAYHGLAGVVAARRGDRSEAHRRDSLLASREDRYYPGTRYYWRAGIAAWLGDPSHAVDLLATAWQKGAFVIGSRLPSPHANAVLEPLEQYPPFHELFRPQG